jgi:hypothetical protein
MRLHVEKAKLEGGEQTAGAGANNQHIGFDHIAHVVSFIGRYRWDGALWAEVTLPV